jgi:DNA-binding protein YbaB
LSLIAAGYNTIGRAAIGARAAATNMIGLQSALAAMSGRPLGTLGRLRAGLTGIALAVPGVGALSSGIAAIGAAVATISAPVWGAFAVTAAAVAAAGVTIWKYWDRIKAILSGVGLAISDTLRPQLDWVGEKLSALTPLTDGFGKAWDWVSEKLSGVGDMLSTVFTKETLSEEDIAQITERAREVTQNIIDWFAGIPAGLAKVGADLVAAGCDIIQSIWDGATERFNAFIAWVGGIPGRIIDAIGSIDLSSLITFGEPPRWLKWMMGEEEAAGPAAGPATEPATLPAAPPPSQAELGALDGDQRAAAKTLMAAREAGDLPTPEHLNDLSDYAGQLREEMASVQAQIDQIDQNGPMGDTLAVPLQRDLRQLQEELAAVEVDLETGRQRANEVTEALRVLGETEAEPEISTASIDRALDRVKQLRAELRAADQGASTPAPATPDVDGARAKGGPIDRKGTYLVGEQGPELITPSRAGFVNTFEAVAGLVRAISQIPAVAASTQGAGPQLIVPTQRVVKPGAADMPETQAAVPFAPDTPDLQPATQTSPDEASAAPSEQKDVTIQVHVGQITVSPSITTTERVDPAALSQAITAAMRDQVRETFRGVFADTSMRFA